MIHPSEERHQKLREILETAKKIARYDLQRKANQEAWSHLQFCIRHGYIAYPTETHNLISVGDYLHPSRADTHPKTLAEKERALGLVVCFSDEPHPSLPRNISHPPKTKVRLVFSSYLSPQDRILVIGSADCYTPVSLGLKLLHEARHARHYFGAEFGELEPLDPEPLHESRTWKFELDLLDVFGGNPWKHAVWEESNFLLKHYQKKNKAPGERYFACTGNAYPDLETVFGKPTLPPTAEWGLLVGMRANFILVEKFVRKENHDNAYANIVNAYYSHASRHRSV